MNASEIAETLANRLRANSAVDANGCIVWLRARNEAGYGIIMINKVGTRRVHRVAYELLVGPIPEGLTLDHLCRNRACWNVEHLEPVTRGENVLRGEGPSAVHARKTHCSHGHPYDEANTLWWRGRRYCRACNRRKSREARQRRKEQANDAE